jgi:hypothetical protein
MATSKIRDTIHACLLTFRAFLVYYWGQITTEKNLEAILEPERGNVSMATLKFHIWTYKLWMKFHIKMTEKFELYGIKIEIYHKYIIY